MTIEIPVFLGLGSRLPCNSKFDLFHTIGYALLITQRPFSCNVFFAFHIIFYVLQQMPFEHIFFKPEELDLQFVSLQTFISLDEKQILK